MISLIIKLFTFCIFLVFLVFLAFIVYITFGLAWIVFKLLCAFVTVFLIFGILTSMID